MQIIAVSASEKKGEKKHNLAAAELRENVGLVGDAHADGSHRQLSLLAIESINAMRGQGIDVNPGDFAENLTTEGVVLHQLPIGARLKVGTSILLELTQIGKECHSGCAIQKQVGQCVMPRQGVFCRILRGGMVRPGDPIEVLPFIAKS